MSYRIGRNFEYKVINLLKNMGLEIIRNKLSRKPDIITNKGFFEIKKTVKKGKIPCFVIKDLKSFFEGKKLVLEVKKYALKDFFYTLTIENKELILIIPFWMDLNYLRDFYNEIKIKNKLLKDTFNFLQGFLEV
jgi:hypothetical protein